MYIKQFLKWIGLKEKLHDKQHKTPLVSEGEIWWASVGENIGSEINGKSDLFSRPVIIYKKLAHDFYFVIPTTSQQKAGSWFVNFKQHGKDTTACLHQARSIDYRRLSNKLGELDNSDFERVKTGFVNLYT
ncbi:type II toxin-antitoxin system PemK/MazF family toxin [Patescibacteria group bacterium]|nr:type II toxin-antitoxin system PemK/MazF family toxin [Patescibacteria group bacterium]